MTELTTDVRGRSIGSMNDTGSAVADSGSGPTSAGDKVVGALSHTVLVIWSLLVWLWM